MDATVHVADGTWHGRTSWTAAPYGWWAHGPGCRTNGDTVTLDPNASPRWGPGDSRRVDYASKPLSSGTGVFMMVRSGRSR